VSTIGGRRESSVCSFFFLQGWLVLVLGDPVQIDHRTWVGNVG
jgi:hypothetical protein